jgi:hypothetical protein
MLRNIVAFAALLLVGPCFAYAQNLASDAGPFEVTVAASGSNNRGFTTGGFSVAGSVGYFVVPFLEIAARDNWTYSDLGSGYGWQNTARAAIDFNIPLNNFEPYIGANIGYFASHNPDAWSPLAAPEVGLKFLFTQNVFIYGQVEYDFFWRDTGNTFNNGQFVYNVGLGFRF